MQSPLGFDFARLDEQDPQGEEQQQQLFKQLLAELKDLKLQMRVQQRELEDKQRELEDKQRQQEDRHRQQLQRLSMGMGTRDQRKNMELQQLKDRLDEKNLLAQQQAKQLEQTTTVHKTIKPDEGPIWKRYHDRHSWQTDTKTIVTEGLQQTNTISETPMYVIGVIAIILKAIDQWIDDYELHGGTISERNVVHSHIIADWGVRVRQRIKERSTNTQQPIHSGIVSSDQYDQHQTPENKVK